jgi:hypothetical protein
MTSKLRLPTPGARYEERNEAETRREIELAFLRQQNGGVGLAKRRTITLVSGSLANNTDEQGLLDLLAPGVLFYSVTSDKAARLRLYAHDAARDADYLRPTSTPPSPGIGVFGEWRWQVEQKKTITPNVYLFNDDDVVNNNIYYTLENLSGSTTTITIELVVVTIEAA